MSVDAVCATTVGLVALAFYAARRGHLPEMGLPEVAFLAFVAIGLVAER